MMTTMTHLQHGRWDFLLTPSIFGRGEFNVNVRWWDVRYGPSTMWEHNATFSSETDALNWALDTLAQDEMPNPHRLRTVYRPRTCYTQLEA